MSPNQPWNLSLAIVPLLFLSLISTNQATGDDSRQEVETLVNWFRPTKRPNSDRKWISGSASELITKPSRVPTSNRTPQTAPNPETHVSLYQAPSGEEDRLSELSNPRNVESHQNFSLLINHDFLISRACLPKEQSMSINLRTNRPFYGFIRASAHPHEPDLIPGIQQFPDRGTCYLEGNGDQEFNITFSYNPALLDTRFGRQDSASHKYCGPLAKKHFLGKNDYQLLVLFTLLVIRVDKNRLSPQDMVIPLNCTILCTDCDTPQRQRKKKGERLLSVSGSNVEDRWKDQNGQPPRAAQGSSQRASRDPIGECDIWKFPKLITLFCCMAILLTTMIISNFIIFLTLLSNSRRDRELINGSGKTRRKSHLEEKPQRSNQSGKQKVQSNKCQNNLPFVINYDGNQTTRSTTFSRNERAIT